MAAEPRSTSSRPSRAARDRRGARHDHHHRRQAASDLPRRPLGRLARPSSRWRTRPIPTARPASTYNATEAQYEEAVEAAVAAFEVTRTLPAYERGRILREISAGIKARREELGRLIEHRGRQADPRRARRGGPGGPDVPPRRRGGRADGRRDRSRSTSCRRRKGRVGITRRFPIGPIAGISPFNFPLNLAAHKVAPAIAAGCTIVLKPPSKDPLTMLDRRRDHRGGRPARGRGQHPADDPRARRPDGRGRSVQAPHLHRQPVGRLADEGAGRQEEGRPRARRQRRRHRRQDGRPRLGGPADPRRRVRLRRPGLHQRPADVRPRGDLGRRSWRRFVEGVEGAQGGRPARPRDRRRADGRREPPRRGPSAGSTRRSRWAARSSPAARPTARSSRRRS